MVKPFIVIGDRTSHGGTVISADNTFDINGKAVARVGDLTVCPKKGCKGVFPIVTGAEDMASMGNPPARHGDKTACGARLISSQVLTTWSDEADQGTGASATSEPLSTLPAQFVAPTNSGICLDCLVAAAKQGAATILRK